MAYVTEDKDVRDIVNLLKTRQIRRQQAADKIKALGFLDWEVKEVLKSV